MIRYDGALGLYVLILKRESFYIVRKNKENDSNANSLTNGQTCDSSVPQCESRKTWGDDRSIYRPFKSRNDWQETMCELGGMVNGVSHTMDTNQKGVICAKKTQDINKEMQSMPETLQEEKVWESFRRFYEIQKKEILFDSMFCSEQNEGFSYTVEYWKTLSEEKKEVLRELFIYRKFMSASQGWQSLQQSSFKLDDALQFLSHKIASFTGRHFTREREKGMRLLQEIISSTWIVSHAFSTIKEKWASLSEEEKDWAVMGCLYGMWWAEPPDVERANIGLPYQVDRLKALGNAVVPQQVRQAWEILTGLTYIKDKL